MNTKLSPAQRRVLLALLRGVKMRRMLPATLLILQRLGLVDHQQKLTGIGLEAAREIQGGKR